MVKIGAITANSLESGYMQNRGDSIETHHFLIQMQNLCKIELFGKKIIYL